MNEIISPKQEHKLSLEIILQAINSGNVVTDHRIAERSKGDVRFQVLMAASRKFRVFWDILPSTSI
jgi:hypothetical protein